MAFFKILTGEHLFAIAGSFSDFGSAKSFADRISRETSYVPEIYVLKENLYVVQIDNSLTRQKADEIVQDLQKKEFQLMLSFSCQERLDKVLIYSRNNL